MNVMGEGEYFALAYHLLIWPVAWFGGGPNVN